MAENPILIDEEALNEKYLPLSMTPVFSERPTQPLGLIWSHPFGTLIEIVPDYVQKNCMKMLNFCYCVCFLILNSINVFHFIRNLFQKQVS